MSQTDSLTALVDYYGLKKEGKVTGDGEPSLGASGKVKATGMMPILHLLDTKEPLLGSGPLERALVRQWVLYLTGCIEPAERKEKLSLLRRVNEHLASNSHLAGAALTGADVLLFHSIHKIFSELTFQEKDKLMHLSRWVPTYVNWSALRIGRHCLDVFVKSCIKGFITNPL